MFHTLRARRYRRNFADDIFNDNVSISIKMFYSQGSNYKEIPALIHIMDWRRPGDKPLSQAMVIILLTHISVTRPQKVNNWTKWNWEYSCHALRRNGCLAISESLTLLDCDWIVEVNQILITDILNGLAFLVLTGQWWHWFAWIHFY